MEVHITQINNMVAQYIATLPILGLCGEEELRPGCESQIGGGTGGG